MVTGKPITSSSQPTSTSSIRTPSTSITTTTTTTTTTITTTTEKGSKVTGHPTKTAQGHSKVLYRIEKAQVPISICILSLVFVVDSLLPDLELRSKFFKLQYEHSDAKGFYDIGFNDIYFVAIWVILLIFIRSFLLDWILEPIARSGFLKKQIKSQKAIQRFKEQGWGVIYYTISWASGFYLYYNSDYYLNCDNLFLNWPHDKLTWAMKFYYLVQGACWLQQIFVLNIEEKRKDYHQMFSHHIITVLLVFGSYYYYFTRIGHVVLTLMDFVDIFLSLAKVLKYCGFATLCDISFLIFLASWVILRHGVYNYLFWHAATKARELMDYNCAKFVIGSSFTPKICYTDRSIDFFLILLGALQIVALIWLYAIYRVFIKVVTGTGAEDIRSDSEEEEEEEEEELEADADLGAAEGQIHQDQLPLRKKQEQDSMEPVEPVSIPQPPPPPPSKEDIIDKQVEQKHQ